MRDQQLAGECQPTGLLGRQDECARLDQLIVALRTGESRVLVVRGEPGVGKSALLRHAERSATGVRVLHAFGVEAETELAFATLHQVCQPLLEWLPGLPAPQRMALETVIGIREGPSPDRFLVGLAVLSLMSHASEERPLLCVIEDAHWLDHASAEVLAFVARRLLAESIALLFCTRRPGRELLALPELEVTGLGAADAGRLLDSVAPAGLDRDIRDRVIAEARGNPRALLELPHGFTVTQVAGGLGLVQPETPPGPVEQNFLDRIKELPEPTRRLLLVAAAEPSGDPDLLYRALPRLGVTLPAALTDELDGLLTLGDRVTFRHPLARSAAYRAASGQDRRLAHRALAEVSDPLINPDRRAWHLASAVRAPEEAVAAELERSAERARARGREATAAALLQRSVALTGDASRRASRAISAAAASLRSGDFPTARASLDAAERHARDHRQQGRIQLIRGQLALVSGRRSHPRSLLLRAAQGMEGVDATLAREIYLNAWAAAVAAADEAELMDISRSIRALPPPRGEPQPMDQLLRGFALLVTGDRAAAASLLRRAAPAMATRTSADILHWGRVVGGLGPSIWDDTLMRAMQSKQVQVCRHAGALADLALHLDDFALTTAWSGDLVGAGALVAEAESVAAATGAELAPTGALWLAALQGKEDDALLLIRSTVERAAAQVQGRALAVAYWSEAALFNGLAKYERAAVAARVASNFSEPWTSFWALPELVEAAVRTSAGDLALTAVDRLAEATGPCPTDWAVGITARCRALVSDGAQAEELYVEAVQRLRRTSWVPELARTHLLYGEWLRRHGRRLDARAQLRRAHEMFTAIGMTAFAERARRELQSTGEIVRKRAIGDPSTDELTPQEREIALLVRDGFSNPEVGARLYLSPRTVEWHLRKIFTKLSISSRRQLRDVLPRASFEALGQGRQRLS